MLNQAVALARKYWLRGGSPYYYARKYMEIGTTPNDYLKRRTLAKEAAKSATAEDRAIVAEVREAGFTQLRKPFDHTDELVTACQGKLGAYLQNPHRPTKGKLFWASLADESDFTPDSAFLRYATQERLFRLAAMYLGEAPMLTNISLQYSFPVPDSPNHSQLWHRDYDDTRMFKVFVYCNDVMNEEDGPLHAADRHALKPMYRNPLYSSRKFTDAQFARIADTSKVQAFKGPTGATFICDTRQSFHYGSRCTTKPRLACFITYSSYTGLYPTSQVASAEPGASERVKVLLSKRLSS